MNRLFAAAALSVCLLSAQNPNLAGVWKADPQKSKGLPPNSSYLEIIEQSGNRFTETAGTFTPHGDDRARIMFDLSGKEAKGQYGGLPIKSTAAWKDGALVIDAKQPGATMKEKYTLSGAGKVLTVELDLAANGHELHRLLVLDKQPESAGEPLRKPEQTAGERFKNVKMLKDVPASSLLNTMRYFAFSLGKDCEHCHVKDHFDAEDKKEKETARKMMELSHDTNEKFFDGKQEVRCYTCHQGHDKPESTPAF
ncbi:MAG TPA: photosynthetic reaction center cytochrome c subunit family protein [Bryobacteraceae bacterium]|nr:photosynthetic reaction center cytochrome c subunit family protein [Bryobacteraceae bacterium]